MGYIYLGFSKGCGKVIFGTQPAGVIMGVLL